MFIVKKQLRRFKLVRTEDPSGISGTGVVAHGVQFEDGTIVMRWRSGTPSTLIYNSTKDLLAVHGHSGLTNIEWIDKEVITSA